jgi:predicted enzyme related to lactoylglutathione lyase
VIEGLQTIIYPVKDLARATTFYRALLGVAPYTEAPYYVGFSAGGQDVGLDPNGHAAGLTGPLAYWAVGDLDGCLTMLLAGGAVVVQPVRDVGGGRRVASVRDADGNVIGLVQTASGAR